MKLESISSAGSTAPARPSSLSSSMSDNISSQTLPSKVSEVAKEVLKTFPHNKRVGNYLLGRTLGEGSFAKVKEGLHMITGEKVAVKVIDKKKAKEDTYVRKNMRREGKLLQGVRHRHVLSLYEIMETENCYYLVTELCQGGDLMDHICAKRKLEEREVRRYIRQIVSAVDHLHKAGILHRDLKVENLLLDENRDIKIIDFGLSNSVRVSHTPEGSIMQELCVTQCGSPAYAAPELLGNKKYGPKVDIWSIGINMYAMLTGNLPFTVEPFNIKVLLNKMLTGEMNPIPESLSRHCKELLRSFLNPDPDKRISLQEVMQHPWINEGKNRPLVSAPFPNKLNADDLEGCIVNHMNSSLEYRISEVVRLVTSNIPSSATATYHLFSRKLRKYNAEMRVKGKVAAADIRMYGNAKTRDFIEVLSLTEPAHQTKFRRGEHSADREDKKAGNRPVSTQSPVKRTDLDSRKMKMNSRTARHPMKEGVKVKDTSPERDPAVKDSPPDDGSSSGDINITTDVFRATPFSRTAPSHQTQVDTQLYKVPVSQASHKTTNPQYPITHHVQNRRSRLESNPGLLNDRCSNEAENSPLELPSVSTHAKSTHAEVRQTYPNDKHSLAENNSHLKENKILTIRSPHLEKGQGQKENEQGHDLNYDKIKEHGGQIKSTSQCTVTVTRRSQSCGPDNKKTNHKATVSDPVTLQERLSLRAGQSPPRRYLIDVNHYDKYTRRTSIRSSHPDNHSKSVETRRHSRNINYLTLNRVRNARPIMNPASTHSKSHKSTEGHLNVTGESTGVNGAITPRITTMKRSSLDTARISGKNDEASVMEITIECKLDGHSEADGRKTANCEATENLALPTISPPLVKHKSCS